MPRFYSKLYKYQYRFRLWITDKIVGIKQKISGNKIIPFNKETHNRNILFIMVGLIGDSIMSIPAITEARKIWPDSLITVLGKKENLELLQDCPSANEFYEAPVIPFSLKGKNKEKELLQWIKQKKFDIGIILLGDQFAKMLYDAGIPYRVGVKGHSLQSCFTHVYDIGSPDTWTPEKRLNALRCLGYTVDNVLPVLWTNPSLSEVVNNRLRQSGLQTNSYVVLHPFGSSQRQWWNLDAVSLLVQELYKRYNLQTILVGGKETVGIIPFSENIIDITGKLTLVELKAVLANASIIITTDSGPFHIAGALKKKMVGLFRARRPELANIYPDTQVIFGNDEVCQVKCKWDQCRKDKCVQLHNISVTQILQEVEKQVQRV